MQDAPSFVEDQCNREEELTVNPEMTTLVSFTRKKHLNEIRDIFSYQKKLKLI